MFWKLQKVKIKVMSKRWIDLTTFFTVSVGIKVARGVGCEGLFSFLPRGQDIPASGFGRCGNMEVCKWQVENGVNVSRNRQSHHFSHSLLVFKYSERWVAAAGYYHAWE